MKRVWNGVWNAMVTKLNMFMHPNSKGFLKDTTLFAYLVNAVRLNGTVSTNWRRFSDLDDQEHGGVVWIRHTYIVLYTYMDRGYGSGGMVPGVWFRGYGSGYGLNAERGAGSIPHGLY